MTPDDWAREHRVYPPTAGVPGPRRPELTPYKLAIVQAVASGNYKRIVDVCGAQMGKTDIELDIIGWRLDQRPCPILFVGPSEQFVEEQFEPRIMQLLDEAKVLRNKVARGKKMTKTRKTIGGVPLRLAHGSSSTALKSDPAGLAIMDEYDEMRRNVGNQGDPLLLVEARGFTYADFITMISSTPSVGPSDEEPDTTSGLAFWKEMPPEDIESPIWKLWQSGTRHHWAWPCPHCEDYFIPRFRHLKWPKGCTPFDAKTKAYMECPRCGCEIDAKHRDSMNQKGRFVAPGQKIDKQGNVTGDLHQTDVISFWTSGLASPFVTWGERASTYLEALKSGEREKQQVAINAGFGELWSAGGGELPERSEMTKLILPFREGDVPSWVMMLTAGIDVQKHMLYYVIRGWGPRGVSILIKKGILYGSTAEQKVWQSCDELVNENYGGLGIRRCLIDSGFRPGKKETVPEHMVYEFCLHHMNNCRPSKGRDTLPTGPVMMRKLETKPDGSRAPYGIDLCHINTDWVKLWVHERIRTPFDAPGAWFLNQSADDEYMASILSEARMKTPAGKPIWIEKSRNNHYLDCEALAYAAGWLELAQRIPGDHPITKPPEGFVSDDHPAAPQVRAPTPAAVTRTGPRIIRPRMGR